MRDDAVSELLGYSLLVGVVITAVIGLSAGSAGLIQAAAADAAQSNAGATAGAFARTVSLVAATNNTYGTIIELMPPEGYELSVIDAADDYRAVKIFAGNEERVALRTGSLGLSSAFRGVTYEGGALIGGEKRLAEMQTAPAVYLSGAAPGRVSLYVCLIALTGDTWVSGSSAVLTIGCQESKTVEWAVPPGTSTRIAVTTAEPRAWKEYFDGAGFSATVDGDTVTASAGGVSDVHVSQIVVRVDRE